MYAKTKLLLVNRVYFREGVLATYLFLPVVVVIFWRSLVSLCLCTQLLIGFFTIEFKLMTKSVVSIFYRIHYVKIVSAARIVWTDQEIADNIASDAMQILAKASTQNLTFFCGKPPKCILGGLFYILGFKFNAVKTQNEIADFLCTTEVSISKSYRGWLKEFPKYFTDINNCNSVLVNSIH